MFSSPEMAYCERRGKITLFLLSHISLLESLSNWSQTPKTPLKTGH